MTGWRCRLAILLSLSMGLPGETAAGEAMPAEGLDRGIVKSVSAVTITADLNARIKRAAFRKGQKFQKGDILVEFDCRQYAAGLAGAEAEAQAELANFNSQAEMAKHSAAGRNDVEIAKAKLDRAQAAARALAIRIEQCQIRAPFNGRVSEISAHEFETPLPNAPLLKIVDDANFEIEIIVSSKSLAWLKAGAEFRFLIDETNETHPAVISRFGAAVDPVSQTIEVTAVFLKTPENILPGMSGSAIFDKPRS
jgi:membrane fusion protein, multidrug efflux system